MLNIFVVKVYMEINVRRTTSTSTSTQLIKRNDLYFCVFVMNKLKNNCADFKNSFNVGKLYSHGLYLLLEKMLCPPVRIRDLPLLVYILWSDVSDVCVLEEKVREMLINLGA